MKIVACDIGGTGIKGALFDSIVKKQITLPTDQSKGKESTLQTLFSVIDELLEDGVTRIGIVSAGAIDPKTGVIVGNTGSMIGWIGFSIKEEVEKRYNIPCYVENDANGAMISEMEEYLNKGIKNAVMITLGTGVGTAVYIDGHLYNGTTNHVEFGHSVLYPNGNDCTCGMKGCAEAHISGAALTKLGKRFLGDKVTHGKILFDEYQKSNPLAIDLVESYIDDILLFLHNLNRTFDPSLFIIGGGVSNNKEIFESVLLKKQKHTQVDKPIYMAKNGNFAGIKGAYLLALHAEHSQ